MQCSYMLHQRSRDLVLSVLLASVVGFVLGASTPSRGRVSPAAGPQPVAGHAEVKSHDSLDGMRFEASQGNVHASAELAGRLVARFERAGLQDDLHEAFQWIARDWDQDEFQNEALVQHVVLRYCDRAVLRWHLLCATGE